MKKTWLVLTVTVLCCAGPIEAEDEYWGNVEHGDSNSIGKFDFYEDGTSASRIGILNSIPMESQKTLLAALPSAQMVKAQQR